MDWLKNNYERALLIAAAIILLAGAGLIIRNVLAFPENFAGQNSSKPKDNTIKPYPVENLKAAEAKVRTPGSWKSGDGSLLVSRLYILSRDGKTLVDPAESPIPLHPPISNAWIFKYRLNPEAGDFKDQDPDRDQFSNLEEFEADTDPTDAKSVPPYYTKLRLLRAIIKPFRLKFTGDTGDGVTFAVNAADAGGRTFLVQIGDMIGKTSYKVIGYEKKSEVRNEIERDISELTIENQETKEKITLVARVEANDPTSFAEFIYLFNNSRFTVKKGDNFHLEPEKDHEYKLIDINERQAVIQDAESGVQHTVPRLQ